MTNHLAIECQYKKFCNLNMTSLPADRKESIIETDGNSRLEYGQIRFDSCGNKRCQYAIVSADTTPDKLHNILIQEWGMHSPNIIISVTGGAKNFKIRSSLEKEFRKSLIKAAVRTGGWIVSGGTHSGVMKLVGNALHDHTVANTSNAIALGIATFGVLHDKDKLRAESSAHYKNDHKCFEYISKKSCSLDRNHSHFILVDDGSEGEFGREIKHRAMLESYVAQHSGEQAIPIVCILVQGGSGSLQTVHDVLQQQTPVVIVDDTGGWANILSRLYDEPFNSVNESAIAEQLTEEGIEYKFAQLTKWTNWARECLMQKRLITIFASDDKNSVADLDIAILQAILKDDQKTTKQHLELALSWDRCDIARNDILTDDAVVSPVDIWTFFKTALHKDQTDFIDLFLDWGLDVEDYLKLPELQELYGKRDGKYIIKKNQALNAAMQTKDVDFCSAYNLLLGIKSDKTDEKSDCVQKKRRPRNKSSTCFNREQALRELFKWAIIHNRQKTARVFWDAMSKDELAAAVVAYKLLTSLAKRSFHKEEKEDYNKHAECYQKLATGILTKCYEDNPKNTILAVTRKLDNWGNITCLQLAASSNARDFMSHRAVQSHLEDIWYGDVQKTANGFWTYILFWLHIILCVFCPFFIFTLPLKQSVVENMQGTNSASKSRPVEDGHSHSRFNGTIPQSQVDEEPDKSKPNMTIASIMAFYQAPFVKFFCNVLFYLIFLLLFATVLLCCTGLRQSNELYCSGLSYLLLSWVIVLAMDEIRQIIHMKAHTVGRKIWFWIKRTDNQMDFASFLLFVAGFTCLKISDFNMDPLLRIRGRILMAIAFVIYCLRVFSLFAVHADLGPKLLMVSKMLKDLFFFLFIWAVIFFAYGVASQALLYPDEKNAKNIFVGSVYKPYWQLYGELFLSEIDYNPGTGELTCSENLTESNDEGLPRCPQENGFVSILSAIYMLLVNVLLLNLLIAMFSYTFEKLVDKTDVIWKFERYYLVEEYYFRPCLVVPFSIFSYIRSIILWLCKNCKEDECSKDNKFVKHMNDDDDKLMKLLTWEHSYVDTYLEDKRIEKENETSSRLDKLANTLDSVKKTTKFLEKLIQTGFDEFNSRKKVSQTSAAVHIRARKSPYPRANKKRFRLEDHMVSWNVPYDGYKPERYTSQRVEERPSWADIKEDCLRDNKGKNKMLFNMYDGKSKVDRTSYVGRYLVVDGFPRNPRGRTGLAGRGVLGRYGPNHSAVWAFTRWKKNGQDIVKTADGRRVIEFISYKRQDTKQWAIPGGMVKAAKNVSDTWARKFIKELLEKSKINTDKEDYFLNFAGIEVFKGYSDDSRNTDNAWIETSVSSFHDEYNSVFGQCEIKHAEEEVEWKEVGTDLDWFEDHESMIKKVAEFRGAYF
ncbi:transient receptor potential cation channel subfamily M member-like 2 [Clavelina lepadiformis]|uniref:transient receptor potential cation channel subfamily M member-like 2 n=1 Tax=Clavelina lepadiformis TaxID=159417 RepID=UPI00404248C2